MNRFQDRRTVRRSDASGHVGLMLVSFAASVLGVRLFLFLTGYPQVGGGTLHIAHALWGGLLLFVASLLPLLVVNRWALTWSALLSGAGVGLFIDEVGKFITQDNDYFFPAAAPIAYAVFLLSVLVLLRARRPRSQTDRAELTRALDQLEDALTGELDVAGHRRLERRLRRLSGRAERPGVRDLAGALLIVVESDELRALEAQPSAIARYARRFSALVGRWVTEHRLRVAIVVGLVTLGALALSDLAVITAVSIDLADGTENDIGRTLNRFAQIDVETTAQVALLLARVAFDAVTGVLLLFAASLLVRGHRDRACGVAHGALLLALTVVNLLVFYFEQFVAAIGALLQLSLLQATAWYRSRYVRPGSGDERDSALTGTGQAETRSRLPTESRAS